jgi:protein-S-isoprenylcysteine O-methyltransferase Ste14
MDRVVTELVLRIAGMAVVFGLVIFLAAGTLHWPEGWIFLLLFNGFVTALSFWLLRFNRELLVERMHGIGKADQKTWDKVFVLVLFAVFLLWLVIMPLDAVRFRWSHMPVWLEVAGGVLFASSFYPFYRAMRDNPYLSPAVRIQTERGHEVVSTGAYAIVRHPMYAGVLPYTAGISLLLGSWIGLAGGGVIMAAVAWRAVQEERMLRDELPGYADYMARVRYRLIPLVW